VIPEKEPYMGNIPDSVRQQSSSFLFKSRIIVTGLVLGILFIILTAFLANQYMNQIREQRLGNISQIIQVAVNSIEPILEEYRSGKLDREDTLEQVTDSVRRMTYDDHSGHNYIFMTDYSGISLVQPYEREMEMTDLWDLQDDSGVYIVRGLVETARSHPEGGFFTYFYHIPGSTEVQEKVSFVRGIPELDCYIGTGKYMGDIRKFQQLYLVRILSLDLALFVLLFILIRVSLREIHTRNLTLQNEIVRRTQAEEELIRHRDHLKELVEDQTRTIGESENKYRRLFENANAAIFILKDNCVVDCNPKTVEIFGIGHEEMIGRSPIEFSPPNQPDGQSSEEKGRVHISRALEEAPQNFEWHHLRPDGKEFDADVSLNRIEIGGEKFVQAIVQDITCRKQAEAEREKLIGELQKALADIRTLSGLVPICANCKRIRDDRGFWNQLEAYMESHTDASFSHGLCPECAEKLYGDEEWFRNMKKRSGSGISSPP